MGGGLLSREAPPRWWQGKLRVHLIFRSHVRCAFRCERGTEMDAALVLQLCTYILRIVASLSGDEHIPQRTRKMRDVGKRP